MLDFIAIAWVKGSGAGAANYVPSLIAEEVGLSGATTAQCLVNLAGAGLVVALQGHRNETVYPITDLGLAVVKAARTVHGG